MKTEPIKVIKDSSKATLILVYRAEFKETLEKEIADRLQGVKHTLFDGSGFIGVEMPAESKSPDVLPHLLREPFIFERQRLPLATWFPDETTDAAGLPQRLIEQTSTVLQAYTGRVRLHVFTPEVDTAKSLAGKARYLEGQLTGPDGFSGMRTGSADLSDKPFHTAVWQVCVVPGGVWSSFSLLSHLSHTHPGGVHRMAKDPLAPSRSYQKIEEALELLDARPRLREQVIDLGAAPGGWSYAFLKRGCRVLAVDNGPLKIKGLDDLPGQLSHEKTDGLRYKPPANWLPVDWLLSDMLIAPGICLGLLRKWLGNGWTRRFIINIKLPQKNPLVAIAPMVEFLEQTPGLDWRLRQMYHDRREVTLTGSLDIGLTPAITPTAARPLKKQARPSAKSAHGKKERKERRKKQPSRPNKIRK